MPAQPVAVVTGSTSGIGEAVARRFAEAGTRVVINSARSVEAGEKLAAELPGAIYVQADIADPDQAAELIRVAVDSFGRIDVLVNNAGVTRSIPHADLAAVTPQVWWDILGVNVVGTWQVTVAAMAHLKAAGGCVVNVSSIAGIRPAGSSIPYAVSKAAIAHLTRLLAAAVGPEVRVNAVAPGLIETPWTRDFTEIRAHVERATPLRRIGTVDDVASAVLALTESAYTTGEVVLVDGGAHLIIG
jgi:ketoreductase RED2